MKPPADAEQALPGAGLLPSWDGLWTDGADEVGAVAGEAGAVVGWIDVSWPGPGEPVRRLQDAVHVPERLLDELPGAVSRARAAREAALRTCRLCGERHIPGHMYDADVCQGCAERHLGVVY